MIGFGGRRAVLALFVSTCFLLPASLAARADDSSYAVGPSPVLKVLLTSGRLNVQTGDVQQITVSGPATLDVHHVAADDVAGRVPAQIPIPEQTVDGPNGPVTMSKEMFVLPQSLQGAHDAVIVRGDGDTTITIPRNTALVFAHVQRGLINISNYNGVFFAHTRAGPIHLDHVSGTGFAQSLRGPVVADDSNFSRIRARTGLGNIFFRGCTSNQIEASSTYGSIVYDNGSFEPGLAHFESQHGNVAVGVQNAGNGVQIGAHSGSGRVYSSFADGTPVNGNPNDAQARVRGGGPIVTTSTQDGAVYLYNGSMAAHPDLQQNVQQNGGWGAAATRQMMQGPRQAPYGGFAPVQQQPRPYAPVQQPRPYQPPVQRAPYQPPASRPYQPPMGRPPNREQSPQHEHERGRPAPETTPHKHPPL